MIDCLTSGPSTTASPITGNQRSALDSLGRFQPASTSPAVIKDSNLMAIRLGAPLSGTSRALSCKTESVPAEGDRQGQCAAHQPRTMATSVI
jgi:hypothetical protein